MDSLKIWDLHKELCTDSIPTHIKSCVTSLTTDTISGGFVVGAGFGDGTVLLLDKRLPNTNQHQIIRNYKEHNNWIVNLKMQKINTNQLISGSSNSVVKFWDIRVDTSTKTINSHKGNMTAFVVHDFAPILASGSDNQFIKVFNTKGDQLSMIYYHEGFLGQRIGPITSLAFHPYKLCLSAGSSDSIISIYSGDLNFIEKMKRSKI